MIVWLSRGLDNVWLRILISFFIFGWLTYIAWTENRHYRDVSRTINLQFEALRKDHRDIQALMKFNTAKFGGIIERNTQTIEDVHREEWPRNSSPPK